MFWGILFLAIPALALAAATWGVLRRKWYGVLPLLVVASVGWLWDESWWETGREYLDACTNQSAVSEAMMLVLADGASMMALAALWAGWSRGWWFWRALIFVAIPGSLVPLEANELILLCLMAMPVLVGAAWILRQCADRINSQCSREGRQKVPRQFSLADLFLVFIVLGLFATSLRSVLVGHIMLADSGLLRLAASIVVAALAAAAPVLARGCGNKWLIFWTMTAAVGAASWWWLGWNSDPLGLANYFRRGVPVSIPLHLMEGELCFVLLVAFFSITYSLVGQLPSQGVKSRTVIACRAALVLLALLVIAPLARIYPGLIPPQTKVIALPPSPEHDAIKRAAFRLYELEWKAAAANPSIPFNVSRKPYLEILNELDKEVVQPGHLTFDVAELARSRVFPTNGRDPMTSLTIELHSEIERAVAEKRDADAVRLSRLQWRIGQTFYWGGSLANYFYGFARNEYSANSAIIAEAPFLAEQECRVLLRESIATEAADLEYATLKAFDDYWINATSGWRDRLEESAVWLSGERGHNYSRVTPAQFHEARRRPLASLRVVQHVLALELYRHEHGEFPEDLAAIRAPYGLPDILDPFTKFPPVYRRTNTGYLLYSVGLDGHDHGGKFGPPNGGIPSETANQDIDLVPGREPIAARWREYIKVRSQFLSPPAPSAPKADAAK